jgi:hypothetical protein
MSGSCLNEVNLTLSACAMRLSRHYRHIHFSLLAFNTVKSSRYTNFTNLACCLLSLMEYKVMRFSYCFRCSRRISVAIHYSVSDFAIHLCCALLPPITLFFTSRDERMLICMVLLTEV